MALLPKLYSLRGLRFGQGLALVAAGSLSSGVVGTLMCLDGGSNPNVCALLLGAAFIGIAVWVAMLFVPVGEVLFRCGMTHVPLILKYVGTPLVLLLGLGAAVSAWMGLGPGAAVRDRTVILLPVLVPAALALIFAVLVTIYSKAVVAHRHRQLREWKERLSQFRRRSPDADTSRIEAFLAMETAPIPSFSVHGAFFPGVTTRSFHDDFERPEWMNQLEANFETVQREIMTVVTDETAFSGEGKGWFRFNKQFKMFKLFRDKWFEENCARCPRTAEILSQVYTNSEIVIAILHPGGRLRNHIDFAAPTLVYQLGIKIPEKCGIRVGTETRNWVEGKGIVFDNAFEHEVWNDSDEIRVVLLVDFCHPELTQAELQFFSTTAPVHAPAPGEGSHIVFHLSTHASETPAA